MSNTATISTTLATVVAPAAPSYAVADFTPTLSRTATHDDIKDYLEIVFKKMGAKVVYKEYVQVWIGEDGRSAWKVDIVAEFATHIIVAEVKGPEKTENNCMYNASGTENHHHTIKQCLAYCMKASFDNIKPIVGMVTDGKEFITFNPLNFNLNAFHKSIVSAPSSRDLKAGEWVKRQPAFKALRKNSLEALVSMPRTRFIGHFMTTIGLI